MEFQKPDAIKKFSEPSPRAYGTRINRYEENDDPQAGGLRRSESRINQTRGDTKTLIWGERDALPLLILDAVNKSPTASSCIGKIEKFIRGSGFSDPGLESMVIDEQGTTLLQLHQYLSTYMALLEGFTVNFKYNGEGKPQITNAFGVPLECFRFKKPEENTTVINELAYNPYFGTGEYTQAQNKVFNTFCIEDVIAQQEAKGDDYAGQVYFYGRVRPPYKFYPVPKYWSAEKWIYVDANIQEFHKENLSNGFFMSALLNVIGDPNEMSQDPRYMKRVVGTDGVERNEPTKTVGEVFDIEMAKTFSGTKKAGSVMVMWSVNQDQFVKVSNFPVNTNYDVMSGTFTDAIRGITIGTEVPAILANLPQQASSLGSDGNAMKAAIELMQANARDPQSVLEQFYNMVLIPNHVNGSSLAKVKILPYSPITTSVTIDKQYWDFLNDKEKATFIKTNVPSVQIDRTPDTQAKPEQSPETLSAQAALRGSVGGVQGVLAVQNSVVQKATSVESAYSILTIIYGFTPIQARQLLGQPTDVTGTPITNPAINPATQDQSVKPIEPDENLKGLNLSEINKLTSIQKKYKSGQLTLDQAKQILTGYGLSEEQQTAWLS